MRVLAADDDAGVLRVLDRLLRTWGYEPVLAHDGNEAWHELKKSDAPRLVILDWDMPGLSGVEVTRNLRSAPHGREVYVLLLTARQHKRDLIEALEGGADDFVSKPFEPRELQLRLAKGVTARESRRPPSNGKAPPTGTTLGGKYRLEKKIAEGGMATVWLGVHLSLGINVAIKFMKPDLAERADFATFEREARAAAKLRSEHIARVYDHGITEEGLPYLVMEYLSGESLRERVERTGPMTMDEIARVVDHVAKALTEAHAQGVIHRDVKPDNILLVDEGESARAFSARLVDFGLAKPVTAASEVAVVSAGTPAFMSPEHLRGNAPANPALDTWGLAATAFVAATATLPFDGLSFDEVYHHVCDDPLPVPSKANRALTTAFDAWFARACHADPTKRFPAPAALAEALREAAAASPSSSGEPRAISGAPTVPATLEAETVPTGPRVS
jgi:serine/threonine-protein kinase